MLDQAVGERGRHFAVHAHLHGASIPIKDDFRGLAHRVAAAGDLAAALGEELDERLGCELGIRRALRARLARRGARVAGGPPVEEEDHDVRGGRICVCDPAALAGAELPENRLPGLRILHGGTGVAIGPIAVAHAEGTSALKQHGSVIREPCARDAQRSPKMKKSIQMLFGMMAVLSIAFAGCVSPEPTDPDVDTVEVDVDVNLEPQLRPAPGDDLCDPPYYACPGGCCCPPGTTCG